MIAVKIVDVEDGLGFVLPDEVAAKLGVVVGGARYLTPTSEGAMRLSKEQPDSADPIEPA